MSNNIKKPVANIRKSVSSDNRKFYALIILAFILWFVSFGLRWFNFWVSMPTSVAIIALLAWDSSKPLIPAQERLWQEALWGLGCAAFLYLTFFIGNQVAGLLFDFAPAQVKSIYALQEQVPTWLIVLILIFVTSPGEEIFWRGFVQRNLTARLGNIKGWLLAAILYAAVHIASLNFILVMAALVAGLIWGLLFIYRKSLSAAIISHIVWVILVFIIAPIT